MSEIEEMRRKLAARRNRPGYKANVEALEAAVRKLTR